ncbi:hypothetical protein HaLaN_05028 [Haematococcus lacustris]|uniref:Uncharacterized protein n=1 Tax=Haematococcus lacustris TaxID=44745 RepID=A0A699YSP0_HAELA|nr:hypothetical protein HaLaN_05028 [Haematococcus lacustris]
MTQVGGAGAAPVRWPAANVKPWHGAAKPAVGKAGGQHDTDGLGIMVVKLAGCLRGALQGVPCRQRSTAHKLAGWCGSTAWSSTYAPAHMTRPFTEAAQLGPPWLQQCHTLAGFVS